MSEFISASILSPLATALAAVTAMPAAMAGALAAFIVLMVILELRRAGAAGVAGVLPRIVATLAIVIAAFAYLGHSAENERAAERRSLERRASELTARALAPGSSLACLSGEAGEAVETACEKIIFASPETAAAAVAFTAARLSLLVDADAFAARGGASVSALAGFRHALELDRFGLVAQVLATRDGCNATQCAEFAGLGDAAVVKANLKARTFDGYVERYVSTWATGLMPPAVDKPAEPAPQVSGTPPPQAPTVAGRYDFPSAASIPPVSIMASEPPLAKEAATSVNGATKGADPSAAPPPVPPRRPQLP